MAEGAQFPLNSNSHLRTRIADPHSLTAGCLPRKHIYRTKASALTNHPAMNQLPINCSEMERAKTNVGVRHMLWTLFVVLLVLWLLGVVSSYTLGGFIHILLVLAVIALVFQLISGRRTAV